MKFTEDQYHGYIVATEFRFPETSGCVKVGETDTTAEGIEFKVTLEGREFKVGLFPFPDHIHVSILTQAGTNQYDTAQFSIKPSGETESEKAENVVKVVIQQCQAYLDTLKMIQQSAHETIKAELCNDLEHIVGSDAEKKALMDKVEGHIRTELEKFGLVSKCKFEQYSKVEFRGYDDKRHLNLDPYILSEGSCSKCSKWWQVRTNPGDKGAVVMYDEPRSAHEYHPVIEEELK